MTQGKNLTDLEKVKFIKKLKSTNGNVSKACQAIGIGRTAVYDHKKNDPDFAALWDEALETTYDTLEQTMYNRAVKGWLEPVFHQGQIVGHVRKFSDRLLEFALKGNRPEKFRDRLDVNQTVSGTLYVNIEAEIDKLYGDGEEETNLLTEGEENAERS